MDDSDLYRVMFDSSNDPQYILDFESERFLDVNNAFLELTGFSREEILAEDFTAGRIVARESLQTYSIKRETRVLRDRDRYEMKIVGKDGQKRPAEVSVRRLQRDGRTLIVGSIKDMSIQKRAQRELWGRIEELGMANVQILALTEKIKRVPELAPKLLNATDDRELVDRAVDLLCSRDGLAYTRVRIYVEREGSLKMISGGEGARGGRRIPIDGDHRVARIFRGVEEPVVTPREAVLPLKGREAPLGVIEVKFDPREIDALKGNERALKGYFDLLGAMANTLGLLLENLKLSDALRQQALTDTLTGAYNRRHFSDRLSEEVQRCSRYGRVMALMMLDVDRFKEINDTMGHRQGDIVLANLSRLLRMLTREVDIVCRYGGDEFAILMPETGARDAIAKAEVLRSAVQELEFGAAHEGLVSPRVTISIGVSSFVKGRTGDDLLREADEALYAAKRLGRNRVSSAADVGEENSMVV